MSKKDELLKVIEDEVYSLGSSLLVDFRKSFNGLPVIGEGSSSAKFVFIGEAPGKNEAKTGRPFCGSAGKILDDLLSSISLKREDIYITNIVKDRPPKNRDPKPEEIELYGPFLDRQIQIIKPKVLVTLGRYSMEYIMRNYGLEDSIEPISVAHGKVYTKGKLIIIPLYHPAAAIYNRQLIEVIKKDIKALNKYK